MLINLNDIRGIVYLGVQGEQYVTSIDIDCSSWLTEYPTGALSITVKRPNDTDTYIADTTLNGNILSWRISLLDTEQNGFGNFQVKLTTSDEIKLSQVLRFLVDDSLTASSTGRDESLPLWIKDPNGVAAPPKTIEKTKIFNFDDLKYVIPLGMQGEKYVRDIRIDCSKWLELYPSGILNISAQRPGETTIYLAETSVADGILTWHITNYDTAIAGSGMFQMRLDEQGKTKLTKIVTTRIQESLKGTFDPDPPTPTPSWVDDVIDAAERAEQSAKDIEDLTVHGHAIPSASQPTVEKTKLPGQPYHLEFGIPSFAGEPVVYSVNGKTGHVELSADDLHLREFMMDGSLKILTRAFENAPGDKLTLYGGNAIDLQALLEEE